MLLTIVATVLLLMMLVLATPPAIIEKSMKRFAIGFVLSLFAVILPLAFFFLSIYMTSAAKEECSNGVLDCFYTGKLALTSFVVWATAALYAVEIAAVRNRARPWITNGLILGAIISSVCLVFGVMTRGHDSMDLLNDQGAQVCLLVPLYTAIWYIARAIHAVRTQPVNLAKLTVALTSTLPFWALGIWWSYKTYSGLPEHVERCFVVTAASRGHRKFVGPFANMTHRGHHRIANQQLVTFWAFESLWRNHGPRTHAAFRRVYNLIGPVIARRITSPWMADVFYVSLKPAEFFARFTLFAVLFQTANSSLVTSAPTFPTHANRKFI